MKNTKIDQSPDKDRPCTYLDNGGIRRISFTKFKTKQEAEKYFPNRLVEWPNSTEREAEL